MAIAEKVASRTWEDGIADLRARLQGALIGPSDRGYGQARSVWNGRTDGRPALIVRCADALDIAAALAFARGHGVPVAVRSGGHSMAGHSTCVGGLVIDLSTMKECEIDPIQQVARVEPGLTWGELAAATQPHGLAITSGDMATLGVGGLTLGGGIGWMARKHGLAIDNLRAVELVTANGRFLRASAAENPELFWGLRGGGGNFGVATAFEFALHQAGIVLGGAVFYDASDTTTTADLLHSYARLAAVAPDELSTQALLMVAPPTPLIPRECHGRRVVVVAMCYTGDLSEGERVVAPLCQLAPPLAAAVGPIPYPAIFALTAAREFPGMRHYVRSSFLKTLDEGALRALVTAAAANMTPETLVQLRVLGGAMGRVTPDATAFAHRDKPFMVVVTNYGSASDGDAERQKRTERVWQMVQPYSAGAYANFLGDEGEARILEAYPAATHARLAALKARYDPTNMFRLNQNIAPATTPPAS